MEIGNVVHGYLSDRDILSKYGTYAYGFSWGEAEGGGAFSP